MLRVLAFDPSTVAAAWALLDVSAAFSFPNPQHVARYVDSGEIARAELRAFIAKLDSTVDLIAIEKPAGYIFDHARAAHLIETANTAGYLAGIVAAIQCEELVELPANTVRAALLGHPRVRGQFAGTAGDAAVKGAILARVEGWPTRSNADVRDAAALALVAGQQADMQRRTRAAGGAR